MCAHAKHRSVRGETIAGASPLTAGLQLSVRDVPDLPHPEGADLLQLLWCPIEEDHAFMEQPAVRWRNAASVTERLHTMPAVHPQAWHNLIPKPCTIDPEAVTDYPYEDAPEELFRRFREHDEPFAEELVQGWSMWSLLTVPGCKVGGYPSWTQGPQWPTCPNCRQRMHHLLTLLGDEGGRNWIPREEWSVAGYDGGIHEAAAMHTEAAEANRSPLDVTFGDNGNYSVFFCPTCPDMPLSTSFDCY